MSNGDTKNRFFSANYVIPVVGSVIKNGVVSINEENEISGLFHAGDEALADKTISSHKGIITPGFVNAHCHLELSHMAGVIPRQTGLVPFLEQVISSRKAADTIIKKAMRDADKAMYKNGIVAVGDHANTNISKDVKEASPIYYHTFVEVLGFDTNADADRLRQAIEVCEEFGSTSSSLTPHAPYSVSRGLFRLLKAAIEDKKSLLSMHNQESDEENKFFRYKRGQFIAFYEKLGVNITRFRAQARNSLQTVIPYLPKTNPLLLVHNTYTSSKDIYYVKRMGKQVAWCLCPNANLYIEGKSPKVINFIQSGHLIVLGTDSLASNDKLCILSELKTLHEKYQDLELSETIKWATINGAKTLGIDDRFGSLEIGKTPGLNLLKNTKGLSITPDTVVEKLI